ncbi:hypothetical protein RB195_024401 [Necator americanus]|uniref:RimM N-terminal domain-containing protein n=1 Tax=Necator americanus TaxID=51031 RepID=A0ABR1EQ86_NECAM
MEDKLLLLETVEKGHGLSGQNVRIVVVPEEGEGHVFAASKIVLFSLTGQTVKTAICRVALMRRAGHLGLPGPCVL